MIVSMTGYGRIEKKYPDFDLTVELKSLNSRYLDVHTKFHDSIYKYENDIIALIRKKCIRGKFYILVNINEDKYKNHSIQLNKNKLKVYINQINQLKKATKILDYN